MKHPGISAREPDMIPKDGSAKLHLRKNHEIKELRRTLSKNKR
jgi:hypothetical protein